MRRALVHEVAPALRTLEPGPLATARFNNASILSRRIYLTDLDLFEAVHAREGGDLRRTIARVTELTRARAGDDPYDVLRDWLAEP
jgi:hypothetical protein